MTGSDLNVPHDLLAHLRAARDLIDRAYAEPLDLDRLARRAGCSRYHFLRAFAATYGMTPRRYLTYRRIERAKDLLRTANLPRPLASRRSDAPSSLLASLVSPDDAAPLTLAPSALTVTEICLLVGFSSLGSFSSRFTTLVGMSPTAYRARAVAQGGPPPVPGCFVLMWSHPRNRGEAPGAPARLASAPTPPRRAS